MEEKIWKFIIENFLKKKAPPSYEDFKFDSNTLDSLRYVKLLLFLEKEFQIELPIEEIKREEFNTVAKIAALVREKQSKAG